MLNLIFYEPRIPGNTGAAIRLAACTGTRLHLIEPLGFDMEEAKLRRAGLDYHDLAHVEIHATLDDAFARIPGNVWAFAGRSTTSYTQVEYGGEDGLLFGPEPDGLPAHVLEDRRLAGIVRIEMVAGARSLNLANAASIGLYEAWRQLGFPGAREP